METPTEGEIVAEDGHVGQAIHQFVIGHHQSLLVTRGEDIIGIMRLTDVFTAVFHMMKECQAGVSRVLWMTNDIFCSP